MKQLITPLFLFVVLTTTGLSHIQAQAITARANFAVNTITDFDEGFLGGGIGVEAAVGRSWSVGTDFSWSGSEDLNLFTFNPAIRFYFNRPMQGFYLGLGGTIHRVKRDNNIPIGFPLDIDRGSTAVIGGPEFQLGIQTRIREQLTMGVKAGFVTFTDVDLEEVAGINLNFTIGWLFN